MSNSLWYADIGLADLEQVGREELEFGEMISNLSAAVCVCRTASPPRTRTGVSSVTPGWRTRSARSWPRWTR